MKVAFSVIGRPQPAGSKRAFPIRRKEGGGFVATGKVAVTDDNPRAREWKDRVASAGFYALAGQSPPDRFAGDPALLRCALGLRVEFTLARPKGHFGTGRNAGEVKGSAPKFPTVKPDATKLLRAVEDALTGVVWHDDAQVVEQAVTKRYGEPEGVRIVVWTV